MKRIVYETESCGRCGGSGWNSYCEMWGHTCFECGTKPHAQGTGRRFTKTAKLAQASLAEFMKAQFSRRADAIEPGMWFYPQSYHRVKLLEVRNPGSSGRVIDGVTIWGIDLVTKHCSYGYSPDSLLPCLPSEIEWDTVVLPFVRTLLGCSVEGETPIGIFKLVAGKAGKRMDYIARSASVENAVAWIGQQPARARRRMFVAPVTHDAGRMRAIA